MAMNIPMPSADSGDFLDDIRFDAKIGRWSKVTFNQETRQRDHIEMPEPFQIAIDFANGEYGWIRTRGGFDLHLALIGRPFPASPGGADYRRGFRFKIYRDDLGLRHFLQTSKVMIEIFEALHTEWERQSPQYPGQVPILNIERASVEYVDSRDGRQTLMRPNITIVGWIPRPAAMSGNGSAQPQPAAPAQPTQYMATPPQPMVAPSAAAPVQQMVPPPAQPLPQAVPAQPMVPPPTQPVAAQPAAPATAPNEFP